MTDSDRFVVLERRAARSEEREKKKQQKENHEEKHQANTIKGSEFELLRNLVGFGYIGFGIYGFFNGLFRSSKEVVFKNRPKKLIATGVINIVGRQVSKFANAGACLFLLYSITRKTTNYLFDEELESLTPIQKQFVYGFLSGAIFKCSRGWKASLFAGTCMGLGCSTLVLLYNKRFISINLS